MKVPPLLAAGWGVPLQHPIKPQCSPGPSATLGRLLPAHPSLLPSTSSQTWATPRPRSLHSQLPQGQKHPGPHPAEESPTGNSLSPSKTAHPRHGGSYIHRRLRKPWDALPLPQHRRGPVPAMHFAASWLPGAGGGVSPTILILLLPAIPPQGCCTHREATQLTAGAGDADF